jgi:hypothetical protein
MKGGKSTSEENKHNLLYFEGISMRELYNSMEKWQNDNNKRLLSLSIQEDRGNYCCIALTNPIEVQVISGNDYYSAGVEGGCLLVDTGK